MRVNTVKGLYKKVKSGEIKESKLLISIDNDSTVFMLVRNRSDNDPVEIGETEGYNDVEALYKLLFPKAMIELF